MIVSDLLQHSDALSFYRGDDWESFRASPDFARLAHNLDGAEVTILRVPRPGAKVDGAAVDDFWVRYLDAQGAGRVARRAPGRPLMRSRLAVSRDHLDKAALVVAFLAGAVGSWGAKSLGFGPFVAVAWTVGAMLLYVAAVTLLGRLRIEPEAIGDNCYYLGFLLTLSSLSATLYQLARSEEQAELMRSIISGFGIALDLDHPRHPAPRDLRPAPAGHRGAGPRDPDRTAAGGAGAAAGARVERRGDQGVLDRGDPARRRARGADPRGGRRGGGGAAGAGGGGGGGAGGARWAGRSRRRARGRCRRSAPA